MGERMTDVEFLREWLRFYGATTGYTLLGWLLASAVQAGSVDELALRDHGVGNRSTRYRHVAQLRRFALDLKARGLLESDEAVGRTLIECLLNG